MVNDSSTTDRLPRILMFPASLRRHSHQRSLVDHLAARMGDRCIVDILSPGDIGLPLFNQDLEADPDVVREVIALNERFVRADGLVVASPEYNGNVSPYLKNTVDWISRLSRMDSSYDGPDAFRDKPLLLASASTGWTGGMLGLQAARAVFGYLGCLTLPAEICVPHADRGLAQNALALSPSLAAHIDWAVSRFLVLVQRVRTP
jgi:NAD(P)H-dependent FMN reductase